MSDDWQREMVKIQRSKLKDALHNAALIGVFVLAAIWVLMTIAPLVSADTIDATRKGYWRISVDGVLLEDQYSAYHTTLEAAANAALACGQTPCIVEIIQPVIQLSVTVTENVVNCPDPIICPECEVCNDPNPEPPLPTTHDVTLNWTIPNQRENGNALPVEELCCYTIEYKTGTSSTIATEVTGGGTSSYTYSNFAPGIWQFRILAEDTNGLQSEWSNWVTATINGDGCISTKPANFTCAIGALGAGTAMCSWTPQCGGVVVQTYDFDYVGAGNGWADAKTITDESAVGFSADEMQAPSPTGQYGFRARPADGDQWSNEQWVQ